MKKVISIVVCAVFAFVALAGMAMAQAKPAAPAPAVAPAPAATTTTTTTTTAPAPAKEITGKVEKGKAGLVLKAADGEYMLMGHDMSKMVGKKVTCMGTGAEKEGKKVLMVTGAKEAK